MPIRFTSDYGVQRVESDSRAADPSQLRWVIKPYLELPESRLRAATWVKLLEPPAACGQDEALLLCQQTEDAWLSWIPDYGEVLLHVSQFLLA